LISAELLERVAAAVTADVAETELRQKFPRTYHRLQ